MIAPDFLPEEFEVIYINYDSEKNEYNSNIIKAKEPEEEIKFFIGNNFNFLQKLDIKNFNYIIFEEDLNLLTDSEFEYYWSNFFEPWLEKINENYLDINLENFKFQLSSTLEKKVLVKKIIHFIMLFFPYVIVKELINENICENIEDIRKKLNDRFNLNLTKINNLINSIYEISKNSKKNNLEQTQMIIDEQLKKQSEYLEIFKNIVNNTDCEKLQNLFLKYKKFDEENLISGE